MGVCGRGRAHRVGDADKRNRWTVWEIKLVSSPTTSPVGVCDDGLSGKVLGSTSDACPGHWGAGSVCWGLPCPAGRGRSQAERMSEVEGRERGVLFQQGGRRLCHTDGATGAWGWGRGSGSGPSQTGVCCGRRSGGPCLPHPEQTSSRGLVIPEAGPGLPRRQCPPADGEATSQPLPQRRPDPRKVGLLNC